MMYNNTNNAYLWSQQYGPYINPMVNPMTYENLSEEERKALYYLISNTIDDLKSEDRKEQTTTTLYADNIPVCEVIDDKPYWYKELAKCKIEDKRKAINELKTELNMPNLRACQQAKRDAIYSSLNMPPRPTYNNYYHDEIKKCPICGRKPELVYREAYDVYDIQCISKILKTPHLFVFGRAEESKKDVVDRWNKLVLEYEIDQEDNYHPCWLRRYF